MKKLLLGLSLLVLGFGCAKESNSNNNNNNGAYVLNQYGQCVSAANGQQAPSYSYCQQGQNGNNGYYLQNGQCISSTGQQVPYNYCQQTGNNGYYLQNGQCISSTGQQVPYNYCQQGQTGGSQQCYGPYSWNGQLFQCGTQHDCRGFTMTSPQGQQVLCM